MTFINDARARIVGALLAFLAAAVLIWAIVIRPDAALHRAAEAHGAEIIATAQAGAAKETIQVLATHQAEADRITARTSETNHEIFTAPGADAPVDPAVHRAGVRALCLQDGRRDPLCTQMFFRYGDSGGAR